MSNPNHIQQQWDDYKRMVIPGNASQAQIDDTERAFYGGVAAFYNIVLGGLSEGPQPTAADAEMLHAIRDEVNNFAAQQTVLALIEAEAKS